jgi:hypothetical protein
VNRIKEPIVSYCKNPQKKFNCFITLGGFGKNNRGKLYIPTRSSKMHHGQMEEYLGTNVSYLIQFEEEKKRIKVPLQKDVTQEINESCEKPVGVDVNVKNNLSNNLSLCDFFRYFHGLFPGSI